MQHGSLRAPVRVFMAAVLLCLSFLAAPKAAAAQLQDVNGITLLSFDSQQIVSIGNQTSGRCSWYALRYARTILDGKPCSGSGMWSNGAVWSAAGYYAYSGSLSGCLSRLYEELQAGRPVIVHLKNTAVSGVSKHTNRVTSYEYHLSGSGWKEVNYPHIATSSTYGHWVCVVGISPTADPENLRESDFYALDPARVSVNGTLAVTKLLDGTVRQITLRQQLLIRCIRRGKRHFAVGEQFVLLAVEHGGLARLHLHDRPAVMGHSRRRRKFAVDRVMQQSIHTGGCLAVLCIA